MTAPHGPSERMPDALAEKLARADLEAFGEDDIPPWSDLTPEERRDAIDETRASLAPYYPLIQAEVRAAVVAEVLAIVEGEAAKQRRLASDAAASKGLGVMHFVAGTEADAIATAIRAQLPPVSAPGPTLPRTPSGWDGPTMREFVRGREWSCVQAETGDVITLDDRGLVTLYGFDGTPLSDLQALLAALASRAERGPGDAND